ncbi:MAG: metallophosphoesterase [Candidatus Nanoarchaeia archaeon]|jgi:hypothetical protein
MKILATADIHGDKKLVDRLIKNSKDADVIVVAGDLTWAENDLRGIIGPLKKQGKPIIMIPGNHETLASVDFLENLYKPGVYNLHARGIKIGDTCFVACGSGNIGLFQLSDDEVTDALEKAIKEVKGCTKTVLVTHTPPYQTLLDNLGWTNAGSKAVRKFIEKHKPDLCLCGHIHETAGLMEKIGKTLVVNVGFSDKIIEI